MQTQIISMLARRSAFSTHKPRGIRISAGFHTGQNRIQFAADRPPVLISMDFLSPEPRERAQRKLAISVSSPLQPESSMLLPGYQISPIFDSIMGPCCTQKL